MTAFKTLSLITAAAVLVVSSAPSAAAFQVPAVISSYQQQSQKMTQCFLHPDQAPDLEACAYDLMKEAFEAEVNTEKAGSNSSVLTLEAPMTEQRGSSNVAIKVISGGPVAWCRRRLWPFSANSNKNKVALKP